MRQILAGLALVVLVLSGCGYRTSSYLHGAWEVKQGDSAQLYDRKRIVYTVDGKVMTSFFRSGVVVEVSSNNYKVVGKNAIRIEGEDYWEEIVMTLPHENLLEMQTVLASHQELIGAQVLLVKTSD